MRRILVIRGGPLRSFVLSLGAFAAIRAHHAADGITLLTTKPFAEIATACPWFDEVWIDDQPPIWRVDQWTSLGTRLRNGAFARVYDLQTDERSGCYYQLMGRPEWSGAVPGCSHRHVDPRREFMHPEERLAAQLALAGVRNLPAPDLRWLRADLARFELPARYALLLPGGESCKRWPAEAFASLGRRMVEAGLTPVLAGTEDEAEVTAAIAVACPGALDLAGRSTICELATLARGASVAVTGDNGAGAVLAASGCRTIQVAAGEFGPLPREPHGTVSLLREEHLDAIAVETVAALALT